jgi:hypothetical protein
LSHLQFEAMLGAGRDSANPNDFALVCLLGLLGLRISEATGLDVTDLGEEHGHRVVRVIGKGHKIVLVPLPPAVARAVDRAVADRLSGPILLNRAGRRMDRHAATRRLHRLQRVAGVRIARMHPHMLRHTFVTTMLDAGVDLRDTQIAARHADPRTTMRSTSAGPHQPRPARQLRPRRLHVRRHLNAPTYRGADVALAAREEGACCGSSALRRRDRRVEDNKMHQQGAGQRLRRRSAGTGRTRRSLPSPATTRPPAQPAPGCVKSCRSRWEAVASPRLDDAPPVDSEVVTNAARSGCWPARPAWQLELPRFNLAVTDDAPAGHRTGAVH